MIVNRNFLNWLKGAMDSIPVHVNSESKVVHLTVYLFRLIKLISRYFIEKRIHVRAAALTYYTAFALIPIAAFVMGIARGFGFDSYIEEYLISRYKDHALMLSLVMEFVDNYLNHVRGGAIVGIGIVMLLWSIFRMFNQIERVFNDIWSIRAKRPWKYKIPNYIAIVFFVPLLILFSSAISFYFKYAIQYFQGSFFISPSLALTLKIFPYFIAWLVLTLFYWFIPFTEVKFKYAALSGLLFGSALMFFKFLYVHSQSWMTTYNTVYGALAAIPFLLLFLQFSWILVLVGCSFCFTMQCLKRFESEDDIRMMSHKYFEFASLVIVKMCVDKRVQQKENLTLSEISNVMPYKMAMTCLERLTSGNILEKVVDNRTQILTAYRPADDIRELTISKFYQKLDDAGTPIEKFTLHQSSPYAYLWTYVEELRENMLKKDDRLLKYLGNEYSVEP